MTPLRTISEAREHGCTHIEVVRSACNRTRVCLLDIIERRTQCRTLDDARLFFQCRRCGGRPDQVYFLNPHTELAYFDYVVQVWNNDRLEVDQVVFAAQSLDEASPAYESVAKRFPHQWVTLQSRRALLRDSDRREFLFDG
ncbi:hypothetical protein [uncultured Pleomorphomonas sp.]|uniref:hypothetical protein n=1 Tax=uncultured Pleomorphomonas sp. TaxID=442121 RepID=UPI00258E9D19|nr:hypothetical protein [uncultured Pleomorphomonas sp.]